MSSMDGTMGMSDHYEVDSMTGKYTGINLSTTQFSTDEVKACPECRGSLRNIARYGRIVRSAFLDESTKRLTVWASHYQRVLTKDLASEQDRLSQSLSTALKPPQDVEIHGQIDEQIKAVKKLTSGKRYNFIYKQMAKIQSFTDKLATEEQPYRRVHDLVETVRRQQMEDRINPFEIGDTQLQLRDHLQATTLLIRCHLIILADVISMHTKTPPHMSKGRLVLMLDANRGWCESVIADAERTKNMRQAIEGHISWANFAAMECDAHNQTTPTETTIEGLEAQHRIDNLKEDALERLQSAETACEKLVGSTESLKADIDNVRDMLREGISVGEMRSVIAAMAGELGGTGHWYKCINGHLFSVGECGMPMELAKCYACGEGVGGRHHRATEGVTRANDVDEILGEMNLDR